MKKTIRTNKGREIDINAIRQSNKNVIAVGNMSVNANGDLLGPGGKIIKKAEEIAREQAIPPTSKAQISIKNPTKDDDKDLAKSFDGPSKKKKENKPTQSHAAKEEILPNGDIIIRGEDGN